MLVERCWKEPSAQGQRFFKYIFSSCSFFRFGTNSFGTTYCQRRNRGNHAVFVANEACLRSWSRAISFPWGREITSHRGLVYKQIAAWGVKVKILQSAKVWPIRVGIYRLKTTREAKQKDGSTMADRQVVTRRMRTHNLPSWLTLRKKIFIMNLEVSGVQKLS